MAVTKVQLVNNIIGIVSGGFFQIKLLQQNNLIIVKH